MPYTTHGKLQYFRNTYYRFVWSEIFYGGLGISYLLYKSSEKKLEWSE